MPSTIRFLRQYLRPAGGTTVADEVSYQRGQELLPATLYRPAGAARPLPGWIVLHGLTRTGRHHASLVRFVHAVARAGNVVLVPEIPEWRELRVAPAITIDTIAAAVRALQQRDDVKHAHVGIFGFSFGATQALIAAADPGTAPLLRGIAAWGGYADIRRVFRFGLTGLHGIDGVTWQTRPDPYGAWIMAGNYLPHIPGYSGARSVADALHELALTAGERGVYAWDPVYDDDKRRLRARLGNDERDLFDLVAPPTTLSERERARDLDRALALAEALADTALRLDPLLDPAPFLPRVDVPVLLAHGRDDRLIPFSETLHLGRALPPERRRSLTITSLFQHSGGTQAGLGTLGTIREGLRFVLLLRRVLRMV